MFNSITSSSANVLTINRYLQHFNAQNTKKFRNLLINALDCGNECEFLSKALKALHESITHESMTSLKNSVLELAEKQQISVARTVQRRKTKAKKSKKLTIYQYVQKQNTDRLSQLNSDLVDHLGSFLNKKESIQLGYLNKQLYIETQKQTYLTKRDFYQDNELVITHKILDKLFWQQTNPFAYSLPTELRIDIKKLNMTNGHEKLFGLQWYKKFFSRVATFTCNNFHYLSYISPESLFGVHGHANIKYDKVELFFEGGGVNSKNAALESHYLKTFCDELDSYLTNTDIDDIRNIDTLIIDGIDKRFVKRMKKNVQTMYITQLKRLVLLLAPFCDIIGFDMELCVDDREEMNALFHSNMTGLHLYHFGRLIFDQSLLNDIKDDDINIKCKLNEILMDARQWLCLEKIDAEFQKYWTGFLNNLEMFGLRKQIKCYRFIFGDCTDLLTLPWHDQFFCDPMPQDMRLIEQLALSKDAISKHSLLKTINFGIHDDDSLRRFAVVLIYLEKNRDIILNTRGNGLPNLKRVTIEIHIKEPQFGYHVKPIDYDLQYDHIHYHDFFKGENNITAEIDPFYSDGLIRIDDCDFTLKSLGEAYRFAISWFQIRQKHEDINLADEYMQFCFNIAHRPHS